jgi:hypothetical protein
MEIDFFGGFTGVYSTEVRMKKFSLFKNPRCSKL